MEKEIFLHLLAWTKNKLVKVVEKGEIRQEETENLLIRTENLRETVKESNFLNTKKNVTA
jgi:hypothetical protein